MVARFNKSYSIEMCVRFTTLIIMIILHKSDNSLLSRFRNPTEFVAPDDTDLMDMDQDMYDNLLEEFPELPQLTKRNRSLPYLKKNFEQSDEYDFMINGADFDYNSTLETSTERDFNVSSTILPNSTNSSDARRWAYWWYYWKGPRVATCYVCNNVWKREIPISPLCHDAFNSDDGRARTMARYFRAHCYRNEYHWDWRHENKWKYGTHYKWQRGLYRGYYGRYLGGCFKRFLDVGSVYTVRGCRGRMPSNGGGFARHRYRKLETLLFGQKDKCVMSSHASLTPFSRAISLYVRYHVCVCEGKFCNNATSTHLTITLFLLILLQFVL